MLQMLKKQDIRPWSEEKHCVFEVLLQVVSNILIFEVETYDLPNRAVTISYGAWLMSHVSVPENVLICKGANTLSLNIKGPVLQ